MRFHYDRKKDAFYLRFDEKPYKESDEVEEGIIFDYDKQKRVIGIEILDASRRLSPSFRVSLEKKEIPISVGSLVP